MASLAENSKGPTFRSIGTLMGQRSQKPKPRTAKQKKLMRLAEGYPLSTGETTNFDPPETQAAGIAKVLAEIIMKEQGKKDKGIIRGRREPIQLHVGTGQ